MSLPRLEVRILGPIGGLENYIHLLRDPASGQVAVVDPVQAGPVLSLLADWGQRLDWIWITHHHHDHVGGVEDLQQAFPTACIVGAGADAHRLPRAQQWVQDGDRLWLGEHPVQVMATPGHTLGHVVYYLPHDGMLFSGDTLFSLGCGRLFEGTATQMWDSLCRLRALPPETWLYPAHEYSASNGRFAALIEPDNPHLLARLAEIQRQIQAGQPTIPTQMGTECLCNPFLRAHIGYENPADGVRQFAELRRRKDVF